MEPVVRFEAVDKEYRRQRVLRGVSFHVEPGEVYCLLGPNGAGKTTILNIASCQILASSGTVRILGKDPVHHASWILGQIGIVTASGRGLWWRLNGEENLMRHALLHHLDTRWARKRVQDLLEAFGLTDHAKKLVGVYSVGMRARLSLARALVHDPRLLILDEPWSGLDPHGQLELIALIRNIASRPGKSVLIASHHLPQVQEVADRVGIIAQGRILVEGRPVELLGLLPFAYAVRVGATAGEARRQGMPAVEEKFSDISSALRRAEDILREGVQEVEVRHRRLEDVYFHLQGTGEARPLDSAGRDDGGRGSR
ncbi:MAG: ABC transporter ATP-binding protein [Acetobacteraceae bacterium]|nr:ABC transporter ATP-binding protein [Acetobacteraceae bacterium]